MSKKIKLSRWLNHKIFGGRPEFMLSSRCYMEDRTHATCIIDRIFFILRGEEDHCHNCFLHDMEEQQCQ